MKKLCYFLVKSLLFSFFALTVAPVLVPGIADEAKAQTSVSSSSNNNALASTMCNAMKLVTGNAGKAFAAFAIISLGIGFFTGKISWGLISCTLLK